MKEERKTMRIRSLKEQGQEEDLQQTTSAERLEMMWQITMDTWAFTGEKIAQSGLSRHLVRVLRPES